MTRRRHHAAVEPVPRPETLPVHFDMAAPADLPSAVGGALRLLGVRDGASGVWLDDDVFTATFGPWRLTTSTANIASVEVTGPFSAWRAIGPRLSLRDRGLTFGSTAAAGVCLRFHRPVPGIEPAGLLRHPSLTITVAHPALLVEALAHR
jgi:hypothetical protein